MLLVFICHIEVLFFVLLLHQCDVADDVDDDKCDVCDVHEDVCG